MSVTRGYGVLEEFLAKERERTAKSLIPNRVRCGKILDLGCGKEAHFLKTQFVEGHGLDKVANDEKVIGQNGNSIAIKRWDFEDNLCIPYPENYFDVVTMLAVVEHIERCRVAGLLEEIQRVLRPNGILIMTTPAGWTDILLKFLALIRIVSTEEINEHKGTYTHTELRKLLLGAGFDEECIVSGYFEAFMNLWVSAKKSS